MIAAAKATAHNRGKPSIEKQVRITVLQGSQEQRLGRRLTRKRIKPDKKSIPLPIVSRKMDQQKKSFVPRTDYSKIAKYFDRVRTKPGDLLSQIIKYGRIDSRVRF